MDAYLGKGAGLRGVSTRGVKGAGGEGKHSEAEWHGGIAGGGSRRGVLEHGSLTIPLLAGRITHRYPQAPAPPHSHSRHASTPRGEWELTGRVWVKGVGM